MERPHTVEAKFNKIQAPPTSPSMPSTTRTPSPGGPIPIPYPTLPPSRLEPELAAISTMIAEMKPTNVILQAWEGYVRRKGAALTGPTTVNQVADDVKARVRTHLEVLRLRAASSDPRMNKSEAQQQFQNYDQKANQLYNMLSSIVKTMNETQTSVIKNMK
jgi:hypothetical protein